MGKSSFGNQRASVKAAIRQEANNSVELSIERQGLPGGAQDVLRELVQRDDSFVEGMLNAIDDNLHASNLRSRR